MTAPDDCPFHDLDPTVTVVIDIGGIAMPYSAERACDEYHLGAALQPVIDTYLETLDRRIAEDQP